MAGEDGDFAVLNVEFDSSLPSQDASMSELSGSGRILNGPALLLVLASTFGRTQFAVCKLVAKFEADVLKRALKIYQSFSISLNY
jgi:hypothetical protein